MDQNQKLVRVKKMFFLAFLTTIWDPQNFTFSSENKQKQPNKWGSGKRKEKTLPGTLPTTAMLIVFSKKTLKIKQNKTKKEHTLIGVKSEGALIAYNVYRATFKKSVGNEM